MKAISTKGLSKGYPSPAAAPTVDDWQPFLASIISRWGAETGERKQNRSKLREREILRAAIRVFARDGISRARLGDIASEAGMPVSSIYEYFSSKEELAYAVPVNHLARYYLEYSEASVKATSPRERLRLFLWLAADFARRNPEWARTLYLEIWPSVLLTETKVRHGLDDYTRVIVHLIRMGEASGEWRTAADTYETAAILTGSVNQVITTWLLYRKPADLMKAIVSMIDRIMMLLPPVGESPTKETPRLATGRMKSAKRNRAGPA